MNGSTSAAGAKVLQWLSIRFFQWRRFWCCHLDCRRRIRHASCTWRNFRTIKGLVGPNGAQAIEMLLAGARNPDAGHTATIIATLFYSFALWFGTLQHDADMDFGNKGAQAIAE